MILATRVEQFVDRLNDSVWFKLSEIVLIVVASTGSIYFMFHSVLKSQWSLVDDQEIAYYLGSDHKINLPEAWNIYVNDTEIGKYGSYPRFRPAFFAFRLLESYLWSDNLALWYWTSLVMFIIFMSIFWYLSAEVIGFVLAAFISFFVVTSYYWIDIFGRLGASEPYAAIGLAIFGLGVYFLYSHPKTINFGWFLACIGAMIATGSKENFFPVLILLAWIAFDQFKKKRINGWGWAWLALTVIWNVWIFSSIALAVGKTGKDVYQQSVSLGVRLAILIAALKRWEVLALFGLCLLFFGIGFIARKKNRQIWVLSIKLGAVLSFLLFVYLTQLIVYGNFPIGDRYDFPALFVWPVVAIALIWYFQQVARLGTHLSYRVLVFMMALMACVFLANSHFQGIKVAQRESLKHVWATHKFTTSVLKLDSLIKQYPNYTLIFQANTPISDYVSAFVYNPFLRYYGVSNPMAVMWAGAPIDHYDGLNATLISDLQNASAHGGVVLTNVSLRPDFIPLSETDGNKCVLVLLSSTEPAKDCAVVYNVNN